jgi:translocation and assembly module TamA
LSKSKLSLSNIRSNYLHFLPILPINLFATFCSAFLLENSLIAIRQPRPSIACCQRLLWQLCVLSAFFLYGATWAATSALASDTAPASGLQYNVIIDAPGSLKPLLENNLDLLRWRGNARLDAAQLQHLVQAAPEQIKTLVATEGFYGPEIVPHFDKTATPWVITLHVKPGEPVLVGMIDLQLQGFPTTGAPDDSFDLNALRASWLLKRDVLFRQADWEVAKRDLLRRTIATRYPRAQLLETSADVDLDTHRANLHVVLASGPLVRLGPVRIEGLQRYPASIVHNLNTIKTGDLYSEAALLELQARLQDTNYFSGVLVNAELDPLPDGTADVATGSAADTAASPAVLTVPLVVRVTENKRKKVDAGLGYSTNTGNRAQISFDDLSLYGLKLKSGVTLETKKQNVHADLYFPLTPTGYSDSIGSAFDRSDVEGEVTSTSTLSAQRSWGSQLLTRNLTLEYLIENKTIAGLPSSHSQSVPLTYGITLRRLDNLLFPAKGYVLNAKIGGALVRLLTDQPFLRASAKFIHYRPLGASGILVLRGEAGALLSKEKTGVPSTYLFRAGGDQSVRGYAYQELGEHIGNANVGARYLATASVEYQQWFLPQWGAAVFYDAGNAADDVKHLAPKSGYGVGARWKSPVGPVNVDIAYGHAVKQYRLHFSLGFTF